MWAENESRSTSLIAFVRLIEQEIRSQFLVFVAGKVGLDDLIPFETQAAQLLKSAFSIVSSGL